MTIQEDQKECVLCNGELILVPNSPNKRKCSKCKQLWIWNGKAWITTVGK